MTTSRTALASIFSSYASPDPPKVILIRAAMRPQLVVKPTPAAQAALEQLAASRASPAPHTCSQRSQRSSMDVAFEPPTLGEHAGEHAGMGRHCRMALQLAGASCRHASGRTSVAQMHLSAAINDAARRKACGAPFVPKMQRDASSPICDRVHRNLSVHTPMKRRFVKCGPKKNS